MLDIHCHILPDVDDGSRSIRETKEMLIEADNAGVDHIVCTPHYRSSSIDHKLIIDRFLQTEKLAHKLNIRLDLGFEVYHEALFDLDEAATKRLCIHGTNSMLLEFSPNLMPVNWRRIIYELTGIGITPIIAHPERYTAVQQNIAIAEEMKELGSLLQVSANYIADPPFTARKRTAVKLLKTELADYIASDAHNPDDYFKFKKALCTLKRSAWPKQYQ